MASYHSQPHVFAVDRPRLDALIDEAGRRARRRRAYLALVVLAVAAGLAAAGFFLFHQGGPSGPKVPPNGAAAKPALPSESGPTVRDRFVRSGALRHGWVRGIPRHLRPVSRVVPLDGGKVFVARGGCLWEMFLVGFLGPSGGCRGGMPTARRSPPRFRANLLVGAGGLIGKHGFITISGSTLVAPGAKLYLLYADGSSDRIRVTWVSEPIRAGFYYFVVPKAHRTEARRPVVAELVRDKKVVARQRLPGGSPGGLRDLHRVD
ncbi:MAG: hypothetical protein ACTHQQ_17795 [Solirubrobacteraceae bacterium]